MPIIDKVVGDNGGLKYTERWQYEGVRPAGLQNNVNGKWKGTRWDGGSGSGDDQDESTMGTAAV